MENSKTKIIVATHKKYKMPNDTYYMPMHVGKEGKESIGFMGDDTGDNISNKNPYYSELTAIYWMWKNLKNDYVGIVHYRRYFTIKGWLYIKTHSMFDCILNNKQIDMLLEKTDVVLPKKRNYYIETLYSHYSHTLYVEPLDETRKIIQEKEKEYLYNFDKHMNGKKAHMFNMFIMKKEILDRYCEWLFPILEELELRVPPEKYNSFHARYIGRISELLLDVWIEKNNISYKEVKVLNMEKVDWIKKGMAFVKAKCLGTKYDKSF